METLGFIGLLSNLVGCPEAALILLISLLLGYPIAFFYRKYIYGKSPNLQHLYFIVTGLGLCFLNYGFDVIHSFVAILITYLVLKICGGTIISVLIVFIYTMIHLLIGYYTTATATYDIKWTMAQCVLTLRLIGLAFNLYDGKQVKNKLSEENQKICLEKVPSALAVFAHSYFPCCFLIGPQLPIKRYLDFTELKLEGKKSRQLPKTLIPGRNRFLLGVFYLAIYQIGYMFVYDDYFTTIEFEQEILWKKLLFLGLWSQITLYKYISCWLITEGSCIIMGLTFNGKDKNGQAKWDGCSNVKLGVFEKATKMNHYIESFNINTNSWVAQYIYKRLKFMKSKMYSYIFTLFFLAVWHGLHSGYYATFFFEFIIISAEKNVTDLLQANKKLVKIVQHKIIYPVIFVFLRIYTFVLMGYAMIPFILLKHQKYIPIFQQFYFLPHIICILIMVSTSFIKKAKDNSKQQMGLGGTSSSYRKNKIDIKIGKKEK